MKTRQYLTWTDLDGYSKHYLLMPDDATEFQRLAEKYSFDFAFMRITGKVTAEKIDLRLVVETLMFEKETT